MKGLLTANVKAHASRYVATSIAIALATAFILACLGIANGFYASLERTLANDTLGAEVVVALKDNADPESNTLIDVDKAVREADLDAKIRTVYFNFTLLEKDGYKSQARVLETPQEPFKFLDIKDGNEPIDQVSIAIDEGTAKALHAKVGDSVRLTGYDAAKQEPFELSLRVSGIYPSGTIAIPTSVVSPEVAKQFLDPEVAPSYVLLAGTDVASVQKVLKSAVTATDFEIQSQQDFVANSVDKFTSGTGIVLAILVTFPALAIITAIIVVSTTFNVLLAQRKRELALLRAIGSTSTQIRNLALKEAILVGVVSALLGVVVGTGLAGLLNHSTGMIPIWKDAFLAVSPTSMAIAFFLGLFIAVVASFGPARRIAGVSPMVALHPDDPNTLASGKRIARTVIGGVVFALGTSLMVGSLFTLEGGTRFGVAFVGGMISFLGALFLVGVLMPKLSSLLGRLIGKRSLTTQLAGENTVRNPTRTGATGTALFLGVTLVVMIMVGAASVRNTVLTEIDDKRPIDAVAISYTEKGFADSEGERIKSLKHVEKVVFTEAYNGSVKVADQDVNLPLVLKNVDLTDYAHSEIPQPKDDEVLVPRSEWNPSAKEITVAVGSKQLKLKPVLAGVPGYVLSEKNFNVMKAEFTNANQYLYVDGSDVLPQLGDVTGTVANRVAYVKIDNNISSDEITSLFNKIGNNADGVDVSGGLPERIMYTTILNVLLAGVVGMLAVSVVVALVGVTNTLALSVVERRRENALLRALGMTRASVRHMLSLEALLIGASALILGIGMGIFYGWAGFRALPLEDVGTPLLQVPWLQVLGISTSVMLAALLASVAPGRKAAKAHPVEAMADAN
ncbi:efflux ABC transporter, permease protein [Gleimia coleocanis DSM 15436]|uniref:Efflux ABC transporter, permease protein n=1 Tax=Gleimia coleocanis DSM 15436 TaxID=525245 RepID=C0VYI4_9ACTO|nr:FtsX-like permease family protein [Gleimia coleocanis]EEH64487.1 efflux ABC transporter, permease protein [Gleimia coleocanis DSM 15436]